MINFDYTNYIIDLRRVFHACPEIAYNEFKTQEIIKKELDSIGVSYETVGTGIVARLDLNRKKTMAFRSDIDALPINEANDLPYKSQNEGFMHACGHDGHIALLLGFIKYCKLNPDKMAYNAVFIFQPAEEAEGGAITMIENGAIDGVDEIYAVHVDPSLKAGIAGLRVGVSMAGAYEFDIEVEGESSHCGEKHLGKDAVNACIDIIGGIYKDIPKEISDETVFHCGKICGGYARNIVADKCVANCTIRYYKDSHLKDILSLIDAKFQNAENLFGVKCKTSLLTNYIPLVNNTDCITKVKKYIDFVDISRKFSAEDFAFYLKEVNGCIIWLGVGDKNENKKLHSPDFDFDEKALLYGFELYKSLILGEK